MTGKVGELIDDMERHDPGREPVPPYYPDTATVRRTLARVMGFDQELPDLLHDVFVEALGSLHTLSHPEKLASWLTSIAVFLVSLALTAWLWVDAADPSTTAPADGKAKALYGDLWWW